MTETELDATFAIRLQGTEDMLLSNPVTNMFWPGGLVRFKTQEEAAKHMAGMVERAAHYNAEFPHLEPRPTALEVVRVRTLLCPVEAVAETATSGTASPATAEAMQQALQPFAAFLDRMLQGFTPDWPRRVGPDFPVVGTNGATLSLGDFLAARAALGGARAPAAG